MQPIKAIQLEYIKDANVPDKLLNDSQLPLTKTSSDRWIA